MGTHTSLPIIPIISTLHIPRQQRTRRAALKPLQGTSHLKRLGHRDGDLENSERVFSWHYQSGHPAPSLNAVEKGLAVFSKAPIRQTAAQPAGLLSAPAACFLLIFARSYLAELFICFHSAKVTPPQPPPAPVPSLSLSSLYARAVQTSRAFISSSPYLQVCNLAITSEHCNCEAFALKVHYKDGHAGL